MRYTLVLALVVGCGPRFVKLDIARAHKLDVGVVGGGNTVCPHGKTPALRALVTYRDNKTVQTRSRVDPRGTLRPSELNWISDVGTIDAKAKLHLPALLQWHDRPISITASVPGRPDVADRIVLVPTFDCDGASNHDGAYGGGYAGRVEVSLAYVDTALNGRLVLARVTETRGAAQYYLIDRRGPAGARFVVSARGGSGWAGSDGIRGGSGYSGTDGISGQSGGTCEDGSDGSDGGDGGDGGEGGDGGDAGAGGNGGEIVITYPDDLPELADAVELDVSAGAGGRGGSGGRGGFGGSGGRGGSGGAAGSMLSDDGKSSCVTRSGRSGRDGRDGSSGRSGTDGDDGRDGEAGTIVRHSSAIEPLFAAEIAEGWAIVR